MMQVEKKNLFINHPYFNFDQNGEEIKSLVTENIHFIALNAFSTNSIDHEAIKKTTPFTFNSQTLKFTPVLKQNTIKNAWFRVISMFIPNFTSFLLSQSSPKENEFNQQVESVRDFFDFLSISSVELSSLKSDEEDTSLALYILKHYQQMYYGLAYLSEYYRLEGHRLESEVINQANEALESFAVCCHITEKLTSDQFYTYTQTFIDFKKAYRVLTFEKYRPLKEILDINKINHPKNWISQKLEAHQNQLFKICLSMKESDLKVFCHEIESILNHSNKKVSKADQFFFILLEDKRFASLHDFCALKLLRYKKYKETVDDFEDRKQTEQIKAALSYIQNKLHLSKIKPNLISSELTFAFSYYQNFEKNF